jgi:TaqI-like C-terminal specificity domain/Eco57I restriction-modification methylase/N-6 DNA Methylase
MPDGATFDSFQRELARLVDIFGRNLAAYKSAAYDEASLRQEFLNPLFRALGWDIENKAGLIPQHREVETESRTQIGGRQKRADYLFRTHPTARFVCEAKKPAEELHASYAFQAKRYAWNKGLALAVLTDFEEMKVFIVGGKPFKDEPDVGLWKTWHFLQYPLVAQEIWNLLSRERVAAGSIDQLIESLPKRPTAKGKGKQGWLFKPDRSRALDTDFLNFLDEARRELASDLLRHNDRADLLEGTQLNEAVQRILDRILFLRICEDRDIDTGRPLDRLVRSWRDDGDPGAARRARQQPLELHEEPPAHYGGSGLRAPKGTLWHTLVRHFRALDRRPPSHIPFFNGNLFKPHFSEELVVGDDWLAHFLDELGDEESPYLFSYIPVEILGTIYERFLGKVVRPHGRGVAIEEKPEVRKAGGVYYTPRYIVEYIVGQTAGKLLAGRKPEDALKLRILDPACGSGSFLIRAFEEVCEHCQQWLTDDLRRTIGDEVTSLKLEGKGQRLLTSSPTAVAWQKKHRDWCWLEENAVHLTTKAKRRILRETIHGVDLDPQAVEVTQLSLYLKMLENENRNTLARERELFGNDEPLLPPLENNIKCGNSLIASDFSLVPEDLVRVRAFDWNVGFRDIIKAGGFDAVIGNPPYGRLLDKAGEQYAQDSFGAFKGVPDVYVAFIEKGIQLLRTQGRLSFIVPAAWLGGPAYRDLREFLLGWRLDEIISLPFDVFSDAYIDTATFVVSKAVAEEKHAVRCFAYGKKEKLERIALAAGRYQVVPSTVWKQSPDLKFVLSAGLANLVQSLLAKTSTRVGDFVEMKRGVLFDTALLRNTKGGKNYHRYFEGDVYRYELNLLADRWVEYGPKMREWPKEFKWFEGARILMRRLVNRQQRLMAACADETFITNKNLYSLLVKPGGQEKEQLLFAMLAILNSRLLSRLYLSQVAQATKDDFPQVTIADVLALPVPSFAPRQAEMLAQHANKLLALTPKLRAAKTDAERQALQNAVTATDEQIDALVYELYGLTPEEIALVEGTR